MTARANSLTERVTPPIDQADRRWSLTATATRAFMTGLGQLGYNVDALFASAGIRDSDLDDPDAQIPCEVLGAVLSGAQRQRFTPNLALELARVTPIGAYPLLDHLVLTSDTLGAGMQQLARYFRLIGGAVVIKIDEEGDPIRVEMTAADRFSVEYNAALTVLRLCHETDGPVLTAAVSFTHQPDDAAAFERALGCPVQGMAGWNGVSVTSAAWGLPLRRRDPALRRVLEDHANEILARLPARVGFAFEVQRALTARVAGGDTRIGALARQLAMSARTLQRRLAAEGVSFQELLEGARKEVAGRYIGDSTLAVGEVAYLVGYSEPAPFHRAFRRWYGMTPAAFRQKRRAERRAGRT